MRLEPLATQERKSHERNIKALQNRETTKLYYHGRGVDWHEDLLVKASAYDRKLTECLPHHPVDRENSLWITQRRRNFSSGQWKCWWGFGEIVSGVCVIGRWLNNIVALF